MRQCILAVVVVIVTACGGSSSTATTGTTGTTGNTAGTPTVTTSVTIANTAFSPASIEVSSGAVVTFTNTDAIAHNVTFASAGIGGTGDFSSGAKTLAMPTAAGVYTYKCTIHASMAGSVTVK